MLGKIKVPEIQKNEKIRKILRAFFDEVEILKFQESPNYDSLSTMIGDAILCFQQEVPKFISIPKHSISLSHDVMSLSSIPKSRFDSAKL